MNIQTIWYLLWREPRDPIKAQTLYALAAMLAPAMAVLIAFSAWDFIEEDLFISLRYAHQVLDGHGLVWNVGDRVEGYTNFLFVVLMAAAGWFGFDMVNASTALGLLSYGALLLLLAQYLRSQLPAKASCVGYEGERKLAWLMPLTLVVAAPNMVIWAFGGMEPVPFALLVSMSVIACLRIDPARRDGRLMVMMRVGLLFAITTLMRPDAGILFALSGVYLSVSFFRARGAVGGPWGGWLDGFWSLAACLGSYLAVMLPYLAWKYHYYGDVMPNTWYAKSYLLNRMFLVKEGLHYASSYLLTPPWPALMLIVSTVFCFHYKWLGAKDVYLLSLIGVFSAYIIWIGGDYMGTTRFFIPVTPLIALALGRQMGYLLATGHRMSIANITIAIVVGLSMLASSIHMLKNNIAVLSGFSVTTHIQQHWPKGSVIATTSAGVVPYLLPDYHYIDMLGINDHHIARQPSNAPKGRQSGYRPGHMKGDGNYVLSRKPDYILIGYFWGTDYRNVPHRFTSGRQIMAHPDLQKYYRKRLVMLDVLAEVADWPYPFVHRLAKTAMQYEAGLARIPFVYYERINPDDPAVEPWQDPLLDFPAAAAPSWWRGWNPDREK